MLSAFTLSAAEGKLRPSRAVRVVAGMMPALTRGVRRVMDSATHVVIGAGLAGASTAWHLARRGRDVVVLERDLPASRGGSSHGSARIFRYAYPDALYTELVQRAVPWWEELASVSSRELVVRTGGLDHGTVTATRELAAVLEGRGVQHEVLGAPEASERWPQLRFETEVLFQPGAGVLDAEATVMSMVDSAQRLGAGLRTGWTVASVEPDAGGYLLRSARGDELRAQQITVAAGGWLPELLPVLPLSRAFRDALPPFEVTQEQAFHFPFDDDFPAGTWPTVIHRTPGWLSYALPGGRDAEFRGLKIAEFHAGKRLPSAAQQDQVITDSARARMIAKVRALYPGLRPQPYAETTCLFTMTTTEDFVIDSCEGITILSACSGHGAKFAPLLGELVTNALLGDAPLPRRFRVH
jgi:sarcosine oxidase